MQKLKNTSNGSKIKNETNMDNFKCGGKEITYCRLKKKVKKIQKKRVQSYKKIKYAKFLFNK